jgi:hypothetical protein
VAGRDDSRVLLLAALGVGGVEVGTARDLVRNADWTAALELPGSPFLLPELHAVLAGCGLLELVPQDARTRLGQAAARNAARNQYLLARLRQVTRALRGVDIPVVLLKGSALIAEAPAYAQVRYLDDVDLLVREADHDRAAAVLERLGFEAGGVPMGFDGRQASSTAAREVHHASAHVDEQGLVVELHTDLPEGWEAEVMRRAVPVAGVEALQPDREDQFGILAAHALGHHRGDARFLARHLADVRMQLDRGVDTAEAGRRYDRGRDGVVAESLRLVDEARAALASSSSSGVTGVERALASGSRLGRTLAGIRYAAGTWWNNSGGGPLRLLFPTRRFMEQRYRVPSGSALVWLLYLARPFIAVGRLLRPPR